MGLDRTFRGGEEYGRAARVVDGDICLEPGSTTGLFDDVRWGVDWQNVNPAETDTCWLACMVESPLPDKARREKINGLSGWVLRRETLVAAPNQVLKPDRHIGRGGAEAGTPSRRLGDAAGSLVMGALEQIFTLFCAGKVRRVLHVQRVESALRKKSCVWLVSGGLERIAEEIEGDI